MIDSNLFQIRVTGVLVNNHKILLVKQKVTSDRCWSLPGGRLEKGETLEEGIVREVEEETGLKTKVIKLLYVCDKIDAKTPLIHITFLLERIKGKITLPSNEFDSNPIHDVQMIPINMLTQLGFSDKFMNIVKNNFPNAGSYMGLKSSIGL